MLKLVKANKGVKSCIAKNKLYKKYPKSDCASTKGSTVSEEALTEKFSELLYEVFTLINKFY